MSSTVKGIVTLALTIVIAWYLYHIAVSILMMVLYWLVPLAAVTGVIYLLYITVGKRVIEGGRRTLP